MTIQVKLIPNSKYNKIEKIGERHYKVWLTAPAVDNKANIMLIKFLADYFQIAKTSISIKHGLKARNKIIEILS